MPHKGQSQLKASQWYKRNGFLSLTPEMGFWNRGRARGWAAPDTKEMENMKEKKIWKKFLEGAVVLDAFIEIAKN